MASLIFFVSSGHFSFNLAINHEPKGKIIQTCFFYRPHVSLLSALYSILSAKMSVRPTMVKMNGFVTFRTSMLLSICKQTR